MEEFESSIEATEFVEKLQALLSDPRLQQWANTTDTNFDVRSAHCLAVAQHALYKFKQELDSAC